MEYSKSLSWVSTAASFRTNCAIFWLPDWAASLFSPGILAAPRNYKSLTAEIYRAAGRPVLIGIDQEGGTRFSLPAPFTQWVSPQELGVLDDEVFVETQAAALARELRAVGCNLDFAPMLDLHTQPNSPVTLGRSLAPSRKKSLA